MACVRKRRGKWVVDWRDPSGQRRWKTFSQSEDCPDPRKEAHKFCSELLENPGDPTWAQVSGAISVNEYSERWLQTLIATDKPNTIRRYRQILKLHILPEFGSRSVKGLRKSEARTWVMRKLTQASPTTGKILKRNTVRNIVATLRALLNAAIEDEIRFNNPVSRLAKVFRLVTPKGVHQEQIRALNKDQRHRFLVSASRVAPLYYPLFFTLAGTGMRLGEATGLQWPDFDPMNREIRIQRSWSRGVTETPKSRHGRTVDVGATLAEVLIRHHNAMRETKLRGRGSHYVTAARPGRLQGVQSRTGKGEGQASAKGELWMFVTAAGTPLDDSNVRAAMRRVLKDAHLPLTFTPHCLRHTYASLLLQQGEPVQYVSRQLGHKSIQITVDLYGKWLPMTNKAAVDRLEMPSGSKIGGQEVAENAQVMELARGIEPPTGGLQNRCSAN